MERCSNCNKKIMSDAEQEKLTRYEWGSYCNGEMTMDIDPFAQEIHHDNTLYWDCEGSRYESMMDI